MNFMNQEVNNTHCLFPNLRLSAYSDMLCMDKIILKGAMTWLLNCVSFMGDMGHMIETDLMTSVAGSDFLISASKVNTLLGENT